MPLILVIAALLAMSLQAKTLTLAEIFEVAKQHVESIPQQHAQIELANAQFKQGLSAFYPNIGFFLNYTRQAVPNRNQSPGVDAFFIPDQWNTRFGASIPSIQGYREIVGLQSVKASIRSQEAQLLLVQTNLYSQVAAAYYALLSAEKDLKDLQELEKSALERLAEIQKFVALGRSREADLLSQQTQTAILHAQVAQGIELVKLNRDALRVMSGMSEDDEAADDTAELPQALDPIEQLLTQIDERADIKTLKEQHRAAELNVKVMWGGHFPTLGLSANYYPYRTGILDAIPWDVGFSLNVPFFSGFGVTAQIESAKSTERGLRYALLLARRNAERQIRANYDNLNGVIKSLPELKKAVVSAQKTYQQQQIDYRNRLTTNLDVNNAMTQLATITRTYDQTRYQGKLAFENLNASLGKIP
jgi:outer membrane protein